MVCKTKVTQLDNLTLQVYNDVLWLYVSVDNLIFVEICQCLQELFYYKPDLDDTRPIFMKHFRKVVSTA